MEPYKDYLFWFTAKSKPELLIRTYLNIRKQNPDAPKGWGETYSYSAHYKNLFEL